MLTHDIPMELRRRKKNK